MSYNYLTEKPRLFTEEGQIVFLKVRDTAGKHLATAGAVMAGKLFEAMTGDSWLVIACIDRLVELGEIIELERQCWAQHRVFIRPNLGR